MLCSSGIRPLFKQWRGDPLVWPVLQLGKKFAEKEIGFVSKDSIFQKLLLFYTQDSALRIWDNGEWQKVAKIRKAAGLCSERAFYTDLSSFDVNRCILFSDRFGREESLLDQAYWKGCQNIAEPAARENLLSQTQQEFLCQTRLP